MYLQFFFFVKPNLVVIHCFGDKFYFEKKKTFWHQINNKLKKDGGMQRYTRYTQAASFNISLIFPTFPTEFTSEFCDSQPSNDTSFALNRDFQNYEIWSKALSCNKLL